MFVGRPWSSSTASFDVCSLFCVRDSLAFGGHRAPRAADLRYLLISSSELIGLCWQARDQRHCCGVCALCLRLDAIDASVMLPSCSGLCSGAWVLMWRRKCWPIFHSCWRLISTFVMLCEREFIRLKVILLLLATDRLFLTSDVVVCPLVNGAMGLWRLFDKCATIFWNRSLPRTLLVA